MKVFELMHELKNMPAGAEVVVTEEDENWRNSVAVVVLEEEMIVSIIGDGQANLLYSKGEDKPR